MDFFVFVQDHRPGGYRTQPTSDGRRDRFNIPDGLARLVGRTGSPRVVLACHDLMNGMNSPPVVSPRTSKLCFWSPTVAASLPGCPPQPQQRFGIVSQQLAVCDSRSKPAYLPPVQPSFLLERINQTPLATGYAADKIFDGHIRMPRGDVGAQQYAHLAQPRPPLLFRSFCARGFKRGSGWANSGGGHGGGLEAPFITGVCASNASTPAALSGCCSTRADWTLCVSFGLPTLLCLSELLH